MFKTLTPLFSFFKSDPNYKCRFDCLFPCEQDRPIVVYYIRLFYNAFVLECVVEIVMCVNLYEFKYR